MTLYEKGINNYNQTIKFYDKYHAQQINDEKYNEFINDLIINRLYYSLAQILWSFCYDDKNYTEKTHHWDRILPMAKTSQDKRRELIRQINSLRRIRNYSDYYVNEHDSNLVSLRIAAQNVFNNFKIFGVSKC